MPGVRQFAGRLVIPPYENDCYAGVFQPQHRDVAHDFDEPFHAALQTATEVVGHNRLTYTSQTTVGAVHNAYVGDTKRLNRAEIPSELIKTDFDIKIDAGLRDPKYPPRVPIVTYLSSVLMRPFQLTNEADRSNDRHRKPQNPLREEAARRELVMRPVLTPIYDDLSEDEGGFPMQPFAQNLYLFEGKVYAWGPVSRPDDDRRRSPTFNAIPRLVKIFHSVRYTVTAE